MVTVITALPELTAVTTPLLTLATAPFDVDQVIDLSAAFAGRTVALRENDSPISSVLLVVSKTTAVTPITCSLTVTLQLELNKLSASEVALITTLPVV